jgi:hypothetical protein
VIGGLQIREPAAFIIGILVEQLGGSGAGKSVFKSLEGTTLGGHYHRCQ